MFFFINNCTIINWKVTDLNYEKDCSNGPEVLILQMDKELHRRVQKDHPPLLIGPFSH